MTINQKNKSLITFRFKDLLGSPITKLKYQVREQKSGKLIADGVTNSKGETVKISRDIETELSVYVKKFASEDMKLIKTVILTHPQMIVNLSSFKILFDLDLVKHEGPKGKYKRKTYVVKPGDTLEKIAKAHGSTVTELAKLNHLHDPDVLSVGQIIKLSHHNNSAPSHSATPKSPNSTKTNKASSNSNTTKQETSAKTNIDKVEPSIFSDISKELDSSKQAIIKAANDTIDYIKDLIPTRSADSGSPKVEATGLCKDNPACLKKGSPPSDLILELNIRLAGFGGALPTNEFTDLTEACVKQFQRDYMGVPETGKVCGGLLQALDEFRDKYGISSFFESMKCPCKTCSGFGKGRDGVFAFPTASQTKQRQATEHPGMHRSLIWGLKAMQFYFEKMPNPKGYKIQGISSGYRCIDRNYQKKRATTNHMGNAVDIVIVNSKGNTVTVPELENTVRAEWFAKYLNTSLGWSKNHFGIERTSDGATSWVHLDVREFDVTTYQKSNFYSTTVEGMNGGYIKQTAEQLKLKGLVICGGNGGALPVQQNKSIDAGKSIGGIIGKVIASHESKGSYTIFNRGTIGKYGWTSGNEDISKRTINEWIALGKLSGDDINKRFAMGKYQIIPETLEMAKSNLGLNGSEPITNDLQETIFKEYFVKKRRGQIYKAIISGSDIDIESAVIAIAQEWASVGIPKDMARTVTKKDKNGNKVKTSLALKKGQSYWAGVGGNKAHTTPESAINALKQMHKDYIELIRQGKKENEAFDTIMAKDTPMF